jgi:site-specific recombinase XerD
MKPTPFPQLLHAFFHEWLVQQRNVSHHTVLSYRDSWRLFLRFVGVEKAKSVANLGLTDLTAVEVLAFLESVEHVRKSSIGTRNCRLAALHSFFNFVADREPLAAAQCAAVLRIPTKQAIKPEVGSLDENDISAILAQPNRSKIEGQRDHVLLAWLLFTTPVPAFKRR